MIKSWIRFWYIIVFRYIWVVPSFKCFPKVLKVRRCFSEIDGCIQIGLGFVGHVIFFIAEDLKWRGGIYGGGNAIQWFIRLLDLLFERLGDISANRPERGRSDGHRSLPLTALLCADDGLAPFVLRKRRKAPGPYSSRAPLSRLISTWNTATHTHTHTHTRLVSPFSRSDRFRDSLLPIPTGRLLPRSRFPSPCIILACSFMANLVGMAFSERTIVEFGSIIHPRTGPKWLIKAAGWSKPVDCIVKTTQSDDVELLCCTALTCATFRELVQDRNFFFPCQTCPLRWSHLARMKHNHSCLSTVVAVAARKNVSQAGTPAIRAICAALSAQLFSLALLKVAHITGGLDNISRGFYHVKIRFRPKMANMSGWMIYPVDDITEFDYIMLFVIPLFEVTSIFLNFDREFCLLAFVNHTALATGTFLFLQVVPSFFF